MTEKYSTFHESDDLSPEVSEETRRELGFIVLYRVMNLDDHSGVEKRHEDGTVEYVIDNQQYPDQGDFAFHGAKAADVAITRAYPHNLHNVHAIQVRPEDIVEPYPEDMPGVVYVKNGTKVVARPVPKEMTDRFIEDPDGNADGFTEAVNNHLFPQEDSTD